MKALRIWTVVVAAVCLTAPVVFGQRVFGGANRDFGAAEMAKIFGKNQAFSATAEMTVADKSGGPITMEAQYAFLKGNLRADVDMSSMKGGKIPPQAAAQMKMMGMDRVVNVYRGDSKVSYTIYPGLKSYCVIDKSTKESGKTPEKEPKIDVTPIGKETLDGHACVKNKVTITYDDGKTQEMTTWAASDLNGFPVQMAMQSGAADLTIHFTNIKTSAPDASLFDPPSDFKKYDSIQELMMSAMGGMRGMMAPPGGATPPAPPQGGGNN